MLATSLAKHHSRDICRSDARQSEEFRRLATAATRKRNTHNSSGAKRTRCGCRRICLALLAALLFSCVPAAAEDALRDGFHKPPHEAWPTAYWLWLNGYVNRDHVERELRDLQAAGIRGVCIFDMGARGDKAGMPPAGPPFMSEHSVADIEHAVRVAQRLGMDVQLSVASSWDMGGTWVPPQHASMALYHTQTRVEGPGQVDLVLPFPELSAKAPRDESGNPAFYRDIAVLAIPAGQRLPGHDFVFQLDPPGVHTLSHAVLCNTPSDDPQRHGPLQLYTKDFSIAVSETAAGEDAFRVVFRGTMKANADPQRFELPQVAARFVRLRILSGHNPRFDRVQLGEFELYDANGVNTVASHTADRSRDGAVLLGYRSAWGHDRTWTAENIHDGAPSGAGGSWSSAGLPPFRIERLDAVIDLSQEIDAHGRLQWDAPPGRWEILRFVCANTGERLKVPSPDSDGLATDHLSREATEAFLDYLIERLQRKLGPLDQTALKHLYLASYEVRGRIWTPDLLDQFEKYRGYAMKPYLPALLGNIVVDDQITARFIYDYRKTLGDLLVDAYYRAAVDKAHAAGLGVESEAGGPGPPIHQVPVDALKALGALDEVRGEFWPKRPAADRLWVVKETACAAHIYDKPRVHMEAFTSMHHWQDGPFDLKPSADRAFCEGANHFVWHTSSHVPPEAGQPGWMYLAGTHINPNVIWWKQARPFLEYLARCSYLLQQGRFVADVCYYYGDQGYNFVPPRHTNPLPALGYDYDVTNRDVLINRMQVRDGRVALPHGLDYALLVLPDREDIDLEVLRRVEQLVRDGATVLGPKPQRATGLFGYPERDGQVREIADRLWGPGDCSRPGQRACGKGRIVWGRTPQEVLASVGHGPDFHYRSCREDARLDFIHRRTADAEIYFVRNQGPEAIQADVTFRVEGRIPEIWDPASAEIRPQHVYRKTPAGVELPLHLPPYGSAFVVFRRGEQSPPPVRLQFTPSAKAEGPEPSAVAAPEVLAWDGQRAEVLAFQSGNVRVTGEDGREGEAAVEGLAARELDGPWQVQFTSPLDETFERTFERLVSWPEHEDQAVRYFSGTARYRRSFEVPADWLQSGRRVRLDLGRLWAVAEVSVNGRSLGIRWKPPYTLDVTDALREGRNELVVDVANTWSNRLAGDARRPADQRKTRTNVPHSGGTTWRNHPLLESGLLGPVQLLPGRIVDVQLDNRPDSQAAEILEATGVRGGVLVHLGCGDGRLTADFGGRAGWLVHGLDRDAEQVRAARERIHSRGLYGVVSADRLRGSTLPYIDNLVNLVVAESLQGVSLQEVLRVLRPQGVAYVREQAGWTRHVKPPLDGTDEWSHYLHDPTNNAVAHDSVVAPPRHMQWVGGPRYSRHHDRLSSVSAVVSAGGRVFSIFDEASPASILIAPQWRLIARDAFNGTVLWKREIGRWHPHLWPLKSGPAQLPRRLVAHGDRVYVTLSIDGPLVALDAATGETVHTYAGTGGTEEILFSDGQLLVLVNPGGPDPELTSPQRIRRGYNASLWDEQERTLMLLDAETGKTVWSRKHTVLPVTLAADRQGVVFHDGRSVVCLDRATGGERWRSEPVERAEKLLGFFAPTLVLYEGVILFAGGETAGQQTGSWYTEGKDTLTALDMEDGRVLWTAYHPPSGYRSAEDVLVAGGLVWTGETTSGRAVGVFSGRDPRTGEVKCEFPPDVSTYWFHHRCYRGKATDRYLLMSRTGIEFLDLKQQHWIPHHWVRGACLYGVMPANGLVYAPQHPCACYLESKMYGFNALRGAPRSEPPLPAGDQRLERGPAYGVVDAAVGSQESRAADWPTYRHDAARSGQASTPLPAELQKRWTRDLGGPLSSPVIAGGRLYVAAIDRHTLHALDAESGRPVWSFTAGGRIDSPPTIHQGLALFGCADGYVYALRAGDGQLAWRFLAAASDQRLGSFGQLESVWPLHGSVLVQDGVLYCVSGRSMFLDGGLRLWRLDPATGQVLSVTRMDDGSSVGEEDPQAYVSWLNMPTALPDILSSDGRRVYMRSQPFHLDGTRLPLVAMPTTGDADRGAPEPTQDAELAHLFSPTGFLDDTNWHRTYWMYGSRFISGWAGYFLAGKAAPAGRLLVFDDDRVYGFGRKPQYFRWSTPIEHHLFAARKPGAAAGTRAAGAESEQGSRVPAGFAVLHDWTRELPILARGLVLSEGKLFVAGPPDVVDEEAAFRAFDDPQVQQQVARQAAALEGQAGGRLCVVSAADGQPLADLELDSPPRFDGMAAARGRLYLVTHDGALTCFAGAE